MTNLESEVVLGTEDESMDPATPLPPLATEKAQEAKSFESLYTQVSDMLQQLQAAHQQEMLRAEKAKKKQRLRKPSTGKKQQTSITVLPESPPPPVPSYMEGDEEGFEVGPVHSHKHIGRPSQNPISLEKLHGMVRERDGEDAGLAGPFRRLDTTLEQHMWGYKQAKEVLGIPLSAVPAEPKKEAGEEQDSEEEQMDEAEKKEKQAQEEAKNQPPPPPTWRDHLGTFVHSIPFKAACSVVIIANAVHLAVVSDLQMKASYDAALQGGEEAQSVHFLDYFFASWFVTEIILRIIPKGPMHFFWSDKAAHLWWNWFDSLIALEAGVGLIIRLSDRSFSFLRVLGILRLARLVKPMKKVKAFRKLRKTIVALVASLVDLFWAFLVVVLVLYMYSIFLSTATVGYFDNFNRTSVVYLASEEAEQVQKVQNYYGSIISTMVSLWSAVSGGNDWMEYAETLHTMGGIWYFATFIGFTAFCTIGLFNVVTGIFVDSAVEAAAMFRSDAEMIADHQDQKAEEAGLVDDLKDLLQKDAGNNVQFKELVKHLKDPKAQAFWQSKMHLSCAQVKDMHKLYERLMPEQPKDNKGVPLADFLHFTRKCKGQPSYVDLLTLMHDQTRLGKYIHKEFEDIKSRLDAVPPPRPGPVPSGRPPLLPGYQEQHA